MKLPIKVAEQIVEEYEDITSLEAIESYFSRLYHFKGEGLDAKKIVGQLEDGRRTYLFPFASVAKQFRLIENDTRTILIDKEPEAKEIVELYILRNKEQYTEETGLEIQVERGEAIFA